MFNLFTIDGVKVVFDIKTCCEWLLDHEEDILAKLPLHYKELIVDTAFKKVGTNRGAIDLKLLCKMLAHIKQGLYKRNHKKAFLAMCDDIYVDGCLSDDEYKELKETGQFRNIPYEDHHRGWCFWVDGYRRVSSCSVEGRRRFVDVIRIYKLNDLYCVVERKKGGKPNERDETYKYKTFKELLGFGMPAYLCPVTMTTTSSSAWAFVTFR